VANKIIHIINCSGQQVPNHWESVGVKYLTYFWLDQDAQVILDPNDIITNECFGFISEAHEKGDGVLIHSVKGQSRACTIVASWIMRRYQWTLLKTLEFLNSRRPDLEIRANFIHQLTDYESRLATQGIGSKTSKWTEVSEKTNEFENEELLLRNTYLNAQMGPFADFTNLPNYSRSCKLRWQDEKSPLPLSTFVEEKEDTDIEAVKEALMEELTANQGVREEPIELEQDPIIEQKYDKAVSSITNSDIVPAVDPEASIVNANIEPFPDGNIEMRMGESMKVLEEKQVITKAESYSTAGDLNKKTIPDNSEDMCLEVVNKKIPIESIKVQTKEVNSNTKHISKELSKDNENLPKKFTVENKVQAKVEKQHSSNRRNTKLVSENEVRKSNKGDVIKKSNTGKLLAEKINSLTSAKNTRKHTTVRQRPEGNSKIMNSANQTVNIGQRKDISPLSLRTQKAPSVSRPGSKGTPNPQRPEVKKAVAKKANAAVRPSSASIKRDSSITKTYVCFTRIVKGRIIGRERRHLQVCVEQSYGS